MFNELLVSLLPYTPHSLVKIFAAPYIAGEDTQAAMQVCQELKQAGFATTLDILGEAVHDPPAAQAALERYLQLMDDILAHDISRNISIKGTALGMAFDFQAARRNIRSLVAEAQQRGIFVRLDMENSPYTQITIDIYRELHRDFANIGMVLQAYLYRSLDDVKLLAAEKANLRICKGIYQEPPEIAIQDREAIRDHYLQILEIQLKEGSYTGIATHDLVLIEKAQEMIRRLQIPSEKYEFQALLGVPIQETLKALIRDGHKVRIYVPFGADWFAYASRRLKENPNLAGYIVKNLFKRRDYGPANGKAS